MDWFRYFLAFIAAAALVLCLAYYLRLWPLELLVSFAPLLTCLLMAALACSGFYIFLKHPLLDSWTMACLVGTVLLSAFSLWKSLTVQPMVSTAPGKPGFVFATFNKEFSNYDYRSAASYFKSQKTDVVALQETTPEAVKQISQLMGADYYYISDKLNTVKRTGAALISRSPLEKTSTIEIGGHSSLVRAETSIKGKQIAFYSLHLVGPFSPNRYSNRGHDIEQAAEQLASDKLPSILGGDFNTTPYSPDLQGFNSTTGQRYNTVTVQQWPECTRYNHNPLLCLRIDHIYTSKNFKLVDTYKSSDLGSDHRALVVKLKN